MLLLLLLQHRSAAAAAAAAAGFIASVHYTCRGRCLPGRPVGRLPILEPRPIIATQSPGHAVPDSDKNYRRSIIQYSIHRFGITVHCPVVVPPIVVNTHNDQPACHSLTRHRRRLPAAKPTRSQQVAGRSCLGNDDRRIAAAFRDLY